MPYSLDQLLDEFGGPKKTATFDGDYIDGLSPSSPASNPEMQPDLSDVPMDRRSGMMPQSLRVVREPQALPPQQPEAAPAPKPGPQEASGGFDWQRALTRLTDGREGVASLDSSRTASARLKLDQGRDQRQAAADENSLQEQKRRAELLRSASDPQSETSAKMRDELLTGFSVIGDSMPNLKPMLDRFAGSMQNMSATDMIAMQERMGGLFNLARQAAQGRQAADEATQKRLATEEEHTRRAQERAEENARRAEGQAEGRAIQRMMAQARIDEAAQRREERAEHANEKDIAAYEKVAGPIDSNLKTLEGVTKSDVKTGWLPDKLQKVRQFIGMKDDAWDTEEAALADVENEIRHGLFGGALSPGEKAEFLKAMPDMSMPRAARDAKLQAVMKRMAEKKQQTGAAHPRAVKALGEKTGAEGNDPEKASKVVRAKAILADPNESSAKKEKATKWLQLNQ